jgi:anti-anti-sigma factor
VALLKIEFIDGDPSRLQVDGEVDLSSADILRTALEEAVTVDPSVLIDMAGVTFIDGVGLQAVLQVAATRNGAGPLVLVNAPRVEWLLDLVGLREASAIVVRDDGGPRGS